MEKSRQIIWLGGFWPDLMIWDPSFSPPPTRQTPFLAPDNAFWRRSMGIEGPPWNPTLDWIKVKEPNRSISEMVK